MGGFGSGREEWSERGTIENFPVLNSNKLCSSKCIAPDQEDMWHWRLDGPAHLGVLLCVADNVLGVTYSLRAPSGAVADRTHYIAMVWCPVYFGGARLFLRCSGRTESAPCGRRVAKLYLFGDGFLCQKCARLVHQCQRESKVDRACRRAAKIERRMGGYGELQDGRLRRPRWMHHRTFARLCAQLQAAEKPINEKFLSVLKRTSPELYDAVLTAPDAQD